MKYIVGKQVTRQLKVKLQVDYVCPNYDTFNSDTEQAVWLNGSVRDYALADTEKLKDEANAVVIKKVKELENAITQNNYQYLNLNCRCKKCGGYQLWSSYYKYEFMGKIIDFLLPHNGWMLAVFFVLIMHVFVNNNNLKNVIYSILIILVLTPTIKGIIKNIKIDCRIKKMKAECLPHIKITSIE